MAKSFWRCCAALSLLAAAGASAHHSVAGEFDTRTRLQLSGTISRVEWTNPHVYIHLDVNDGHGAITPWRLETLSTAKLRKAGLTKEMLVGDGKPVSADGYLARDGTKNLAWVLKLTYDDGHFFQFPGD